MRVTARAQQTRDTQHRHAVLLAVTTVFALATAPVVRGDVLILKNGEQIEGEVSPADSVGVLRVVIDDNAAVEIAEADVERRIERKSPLRRFDERLAELRPDDLDGLVALADWAERNKLRRRVHQAYERILDVDPNHALARRRLGYVVFRNRWMHEKDLRRQPGLVRLEGEWMSLADREARLREALRASLAADFEGVDSENEHIQAYSIGRIKERRDPRLREVLLGFLDHSSPAVRIVALEVLASTRPASTKDLLPSGGKDHAAARRELEERLADVEKRVGAALVRRTTDEADPLVRQVLLRFLERTPNEAFFELALESTSSELDSLQRDRVIEGILHALRKQWVPRVIEALAVRPPGSPENGNPTLRRLLERVFAVELGYDVEAWNRWWRANSYRFTEGA